jgi:hypothetical protein
VTDVVAEAKKFMSAEVAQVYIAAKLIRDWQKETGYTLDELLDYIEEMYPKRDISG